MIFCMNLYHIDYLLPGGTDELTICLIYIICSLEDENDGHLQTFDEFFKDLLLNTHS